MHGGSTPTSLYVTLVLSAACVLRKRPPLQRLARAIQHVDDRVSVPYSIVLSSWRLCSRLAAHDSNPPIAQVVFYQSGVGAANNIYSKLVDGMSARVVGGRV